MKKLSAKLGRIAETETDDLVRQVMRGVAEGLRGTPDDNLDGPEAPDAANPYAALAEEHGLDVGAFTTWAKKTGIHHEEVALVDVAEFRRGRS
jgi:hypothetical protein